VSELHPVGIVLFDGQCVFCDGFVRWLLERDPRGQLRFAPLQGETAAELRARHPEIPREHDTVVFVEAAGAEPHVRLRSDAALRIFSLIEGPWRHLAILRWLPHPLRDLPYRLFVRLRYRVFGRFDTCPIPTPDVARRFLA
jgi:predicted DCC family thiol-disulfide oxidoreductase YuxK